MNIVTLEASATSYPAISRPAFGGWPLQAAPHLMALSAIEPSHHQASDEVGVDFAPFGWAAQEPRLTPGPGRSTGNQHG
jgi:hypothetical protein